MRFYLMMLLCLPLLASTTALGQTQEIISVPFVDKTAVNSPFEIVTAEVTLEETIRGNQVRALWGEKIISKNVSGKPVLMYMATLTLNGRHDRGTHRGPGDGPTYVVSDDRFFSQNLIKPDETLTVRDAKPDGGTECCINPVVPQTEPKAEFRIVFVQFADGSMFGDSSYAKDDFAAREMILNGLRTLMKSYSQHGIQGFLNEMHSRSAWSQTLPFAQISNSYKERGVGSAIADARDILVTAENRETSIRGKH